MMPAQLILGSMALVSVSEHGKFQFSFKRGKCYKQGRPALLYQLVDYDKARALQPSAPVEGGLLASLVAALCAF
jgi:hypothetical protein